MRVNLRDGAHLTLECFAYDLAVLGNGASEQQKHLREIDLMSVLKSFLRDESGATAIEYGLIAAGISVAIIVVVQGLGTKLSNVFSNVSTAIN